MSSNARQIALGKLLRDLRKSAGVTVQQAAGHLECSIAKIGHWERGKYRTNRSELADLLELYAVDAETCERVDNLRREAAKNTHEWWDPYDLPQWFSPFVGLEQEAIEVFTFELGLVPGLLQTGDYAREVHRAGRFTAVESQIESWVDLRLKRQERLYEGNPLVAQVVLAEEALHRVVGSRAVMREQVESLIEKSGRDNVVVRLLPLESGAHMSPQGSFAVLRFPAHTSDIAFVDTPLSGRIVDNSRDTAELSRVFAALQHGALTVDQSLVRLRTLAEDFRAHQ